MASYPDSQANKRSMNADERKWRAEDDFRTIERAEEVRGDKSRHRDAISHGRQRLKTLKRVVGANGRGTSRARMRKR